MRFVLESLSHGFRIVSLAFRLFANLLAGHLIIHLSKLRLIGLVCTGIALTGTCLVMVFCSLYGIFVIVIQIHVL